MRTKIFGVLEVGTLLMLALGGVLGYMYANYSAPDEAEEA